MRAGALDLRVEPGTLSRLAALCLFFAALATLTGCGGGSGSSTVAEGQLRAAKKAGEEAAHEKDRVDSLQKQVKQLRRQVHHARSAGSSAPAVNPSTAYSSQSVGEVLRTFHVASGNISCEIVVDGATCTVEPIAQTFAFREREAAYTESGTVLPEDLGEVAPYGSTVSAGSVNCEIPPTNVPRGIICNDSSSGHGFEASRIPERQSVY
ncbi:MAG: hypothetical protein ACTHLH_08870 [Solirubrobacterales bacterium]